VVQFAIAVALFAVIAWVYFAPNAMQGDVLQQNDVMQGLANGHEVAVYQAQTGEHSRWTDAMFGGMPTFQISPSYKGTSYLQPVIDLYRLYFPTPVSWLFVLMLGAFVLMLSFKMKWYVAVIGAIGYAFSSYFLILMGAGHIWKLMVLAYIPPTLAGIVWCYRGKYVGGAAIAALFGALQLASNHVQMSYYSMFVVVALMVAFLVKAIREGHVARWCVASAALVVAAGLALAANCPNLLLTYKYSQETIRGGHSELTPVDGMQPQASHNGLDKDYITQWSYGKDETLTLLIPNAKGGATVAPADGQLALASLANTRKAQSMAEDGQLSGQDMQVLQQFPQYFGDQPMTNGPVYVGALICALFLLGCLVVKGPIKWALLVVTILSILLSWGHNMMWLTDWMIDYFPMYNKFRTVASILVIAELTMPLLAAMALCEMFSQPNFYQRHRHAIWVSFGLCALLCLLCVLAPGLMGHYSAQEHEQLVASGQIQQFPSVDAAISAVRASLVRGDALRSLVVLIIGFALLMCYWRGKLGALATSLLVGAVVLVDMYAVGKRYINSESFTSKFDVPEQSFTPRPADEQILQDKDINYRVMDLQHFGEAMPSYFHKTIGGYHAAKLSRYNDLIERQISKNNMQVLNMLNTRYVIVNDNQVQRNPAALGNAWFVDTLTYVTSADQEMAFLDHFDASKQAVADQQFRQVLGQAHAVQPGDTIIETSYAPNHLTYKSHSAAGGLAVFSEIYFPWGWKVTLDGKPIEMGRVNYVLRALQLPAGDHVIDFKYDPDEVHQSEIIATVAVIAIFLLLLLALNWSLFGKRKALPSPTDKA